MDGLLETSFGPGGDVSEASADHSYHRTCRPPPNATPHHHSCNLPQRSIDLVIVLLYTITQNAIYTLENCKM